MIIFIIQFINKNKISQDIIFKEILEEKENLKTLNKKFKFQIDDYIEKLNKYQDVNISLSEKIKTLEIKLTNFKFKINTLNRTLIEKDKEIASLKYDLDKFDKEKYNDIIYKMENLRLTNIELNKELDRKNDIINNLENINDENEKLIDKYYKENKLFKIDNPQSHYIDLLNANVKTLKNIRDENKILRKELWKYDKNPEFEPIETERENSFLFKMEKNYSTKVIYLIH
jgi:hypothetical protein